MGRPVIGRYLSQPYMGALPYTCFQEDIWERVGDDQYRNLGLRSIPCHHE